MTLKYPHLDYQQDAIDPPWAVFEWPVQGFGEASARKAIANTLEPESSELLGNLQQVQENANFIEKSASLVCRGRRPTFPQFLGEMETVPARPMSTSHASLNWHRQLGLRKFASFAFGGYPVRAWCPSLGNDERALTKAL